MLGVGFLLAASTLLIVNMMTDDSNANTKITSASYSLPISLENNPINTDTLAQSVNNAESDTGAEASNTSVSATPAIKPAWQDVAVTSGDTLVSLLSDLNVNNQDISNLISIPIVKRSLSHLQIGENIQIKLNNENHLVGLRYPISAQQMLNVEEKNNTYLANISTLKTQIRDKYAGAVINGSLYTSANQVGVPRKTMAELTHIFSSQINFTKDLKSGDAFQIIYQDKFNQEHHLGAGNILAARLYVKGHEYTAIGYRDPQGAFQYYTPAGKSLKGGFLRAPVHYSHISSPFNLSRYHPILHINRPHEGVDLAAPRGAPVSAAANGKVVFIGRGGGYGNMITIDHGNGVTTKYAHLSGFMKGLHTGSYVHEGDKIGYVGSSGLATGPHLHFEVRIHNLPKNPLTIPLANFGSQLDSKDKRHFLAQADPLLEELNQKQPLPASE